MSILMMLLALVLFGLLHSLTAAPGFKRAARARLGERAYLGLYRLLYNLFSVILFAPLAVLGIVYPGPVIWSAQGALAVLLQGVQVIALIGFGIALLQVDLWRFAGLRQAWAWLNDEPLPLPPESLIQHGAYGLVRHPLYLFGMLYLWAAPHMNGSGLGFVIGSSVYFIIGSWLEECRMQHDFGPVYAAYQRRVPAMIPFVRLPSPRCTADESVAPRVGEQVRSQTD